MMMVCVQKERCLLLSIQFSGAKVVKANTFILELKFTHQDGIIILLLLSVFFLMVRYYNYAKPYHEKLFNLWSSRMLREPLFLERNPYDPELRGLIPELVPEGLDIEHMGYDDSSYISWSYHCRFFLFRAIKYDWFIEQIDESNSVDIFKNVSFTTYVKVLKLELKYQFLGFFTHRENLDILAPYFLGVSAIISYFY